MIISYVKKRINLKIVLPFIAIVIIIAIFIIFWIGDIISNNIEVRVIENLRKSGFFTDRIINDNEKRAIFFAQFMSDMEKLYSQIPNTRLIHSLIIYLLQILKENKMSVQLINKEENIKSTLIKKGFMGMRTSDILEELDGNELSLSIGAVAPIEEKDRIDKIVLIKFPFNKDFIQNMKGKIGADITLIYKNRIISSTLANSDCIGKIKNMISPQISRSIMDGENITADINCELHTQKILLRPISIGTKNRFIVGISLSLKNLRLTESRIRRTTIYITTLVLTLLAFVYYMITRKVVNPLKALSKATSEVAKGNLEQGIMVKTEDDEVGNLAKSFNKMVSELKRSREEIEEWNRILERRVEERTAKLKETQTQLIRAGRLSAVGELAAGVAHEINNPISGILGYCEIIMESFKNKNVESEEVKNYITSIRYVKEAAERCKNVVESLLQFSRMPEPEFKSLDINSLLDDTLIFLDSQLSSKGINVIKEFDRDIPETIGDYNLLHHVFINIILNSVFFMGDNGILKLSTSVINDKNPYLEIKIEDNGCGIPEENLDKIFNPFFTTKKPGEGTGLGLSISYRIIKDHDGDIKVESELNKGTTFTITLPVIEERRKHKRYKILDNKEIFIEIKDNNSWIKTSLIDISHYGLKLKNIKPLDVGSVHIFKIFLPKTKKKLLEIMGEVRWSNSSFIGIRILDGYIEDWLRIYEKLFNYIKY